MKLSKEDDQRFKRLASDMNDIFEGSHDSGFNTDYAIISQNKFKPLLGDMKDLLGHYMSEDEFYVKGSYIEGYDMNNVCCTLNYIMDRWGSCHRLDWLIDWVECKDWN